jgi:cytochrome c oxidase subunit 2
MAGMIDLQLWFISFLFSLITVFVVYSAVVYRHRPGDAGVGANFKSSNQLEIFWTIIPLGLVIFLSFLGSKDLAQTRRAEPNALEVKVTAFQWGWLFEYPNNGDIKSNQLYLPVDQQVHLTMTSRDVIHSFWVPEFGIKQDILPGANLVKELRINPTRIGSYTVYCNQLCGGAHAYMTAPVKVVSKQDFESWVASQNNSASLTPAQRGEKAAPTSGCIGCHTITGAKSVGPTWKGLAGSQVKLADGSTVTADDAYLHDSIVDPNKQIAEGFPPNLMPKTYKNSLSEQQIQDLIAFIKTLK